MKRQDLINVIYCAQGAMQHVIDNWEKGDLAAAVRAMQEIKQNEVDPAIAWWEND